MNALSVIIPSRSADNLIPCVKAIREARETCRIIVVDDGIASGPCEVALYSNRLACASPLPNQVHTVNGVKPFVFSRNVNIGIQAAGTDDIIILNDDALLKTPGGFTAMQANAGDYGIVGAVTNNVGNVNQFQSSRRGDYPPRKEPRMLCFVCVFIPRSTIDWLGLLDEDFVDYGCEDDDYCFRAREAGLTLGVYDGCFVDHGSLRSSFRGPAGAGGDFQPNLRRFIAKHGVDNWNKGRDQSKFRHLFPPETCA